MLSLFISQEPKVRDSNSSELSETYKYKSEKVKLNFLSINFGNLLKSKTENLLTIAF